jgi:cyclophilin family peptidyl-prolyl cis-trans isomerase
MPSDKRDRQRQNREQKRKREERSRRLKLIRRRLVQAVWFALIVAGVVTVSNLIERSNTSTTTTTSATSTTTQPSDLGATFDEYRAQPTACGATAPPPAQEMQFDAPVDQQLDPNTPVTATISTSCGDIVIQLDPKLAPEAVNSFVFLARQGYFDGTVFSRIVPGFVIQGGDPTATNTGGPGYVLPDEYPAAGFAYDRGAVAMANAGAGSTGSQFFIALGATGLDPNYSPLGTVIEGDATLDAIANVPVGPNATGVETSRPLETVYIDSVTINVGA